MSRVVIPWESLSTVALENLIQEFVSREGTEYGDFDVELATKVKQVHLQLRSLDAIVVFDSNDASASIVLKSAIDQLSDK